MSYNTFIKVLPQTDFLQAISQQNNAESIFAILITETNERTLIDIYNFLIENKTKKILLAIPDFYSLQPDSYILLARFFFLPNYYRRDNLSIILNFLTADSSNKNKLNDETKEFTFLDFLSSQNLDSLKIIDLTVSTGLNDHFFLVNKNYSTSNINPENLTLFKEYPLNYFSDIIILTKNLSGLQTFQAKIEKKLDKQLSDSKNIKEVLKEYRVLLNTVALLKKERDYYKENYKNQETYIEIIKKSNQTVEILEFYHNEYEALPLWYKRIGHIIKVLLGKRSMRSLFNDNVKKYKD